MLGCFTCHVGLLTVVWVGLGEKKKYWPGLFFGSYQRGILESQSTFTSLLILFGKTGTDERVLQCFT